MAEVLSLAASIIVVLGAAEVVAKSLSKVRTIRNAPDEIHALNNEVSDLEVILSDVQDFIQNESSPHASQKYLQHLSTIVGRLHQKLLQLDELVRCKVLKPQSSPELFKISKTGWLKAARTIERYRQSLRDNRLNLVTQMVLINSLCAHQSRVTLAIDEIYIISGQLRHGQFQSERTCLQLDEHTRLLHELLHRQASIQRLVPTQQALNEPIKAPAIESGLMFRTQDSTPVIRIRARASNIQRISYASTCECACHSLRTFDSPSILQNAVGTLFAGYTGNPVMSNLRCTAASCISKTAFRGCINNPFPYWFLAKVLIISFMRDFSGEIRAALTVRRVVPYFADVLRFVSSDDVDGMKELFCSGSASPNDSQTDGVSVLMRAVHRCNFEMCDLLLKAGGDPHLTNFDNSHSAHHIAWSLILESTFDSPKSEALRSLFPQDADLIDNRRFSRLHKAVLRLEILDLETAITTFKSVIDDADADGYTTLMWAARRGDGPAVESLVKAGANVDRQGRFAETAFLLAARSSGFPTLQTLIKAGADPRHADIWGYSALHYAAKSGTSSARMVKSLAEVGADLDAKNSFGQPPLLQAACSNNIEIAEALLDQGANVHFVDSDGDSAIVQSIFSHADDMTQLLLSCGVDYTHWASDGLSVLHLTALSGGLRTLDILLAAQIQDIDPDAVSRQGQTVLQVAKARTSKPEGFVEKLLDLGWMGGSLDCLWSMLGPEDFLEP